MMVSNVVSHQLSRREGLSVVLLDRQAVLSVPLRATLLLSLKQAACFIVPPGWGFFCTKSYSPLLQLCLTIIFIFKDSFLFL